MSGLRLLLCVALLGMALGFQTKSGVSAALKAKIIAQHNSCRQDAAAANGYNLDDVAWNDDLATYAQAKIDEFSDFKVSSMGHSSKYQTCRIKGLECESIGENIAGGYGTGPTVADSKAASLMDSSVEQSGAPQWCAEKANFSASAKSCLAGKTCGHFTQMVWDSAKEIGCGARLNYRDGEYQWGLICNYNTAGNLNGYNVYDPNRGIGKFEVCSQNQGGMCASDGKFDASVSEEKAGTGAGSSNTPLAASCTAVNSPTKESNPSYSYAKGSESGGDEIGGQIAAMNFQTQVVTCGSCTASWFVNESNERQFMFSSAGFCPAQATDKSTVTAP